MLGTPNDVRPDRQAGILAGVRVMRVIGIVGAAGAILQAAYISLWGLFYLTEGRLGPWGAWWWGVVVLFLLLLAWQALEARARPPLRSFRLIFLLLSPLVWIVFSHAAPGFDLTQPVDALWIVGLACATVAYPVLALTPARAYGEDTYSRYVSAEEEE